MTNRYLRSVNIAHDLSQSGHELHGYMATPLVLQTVARIMRGCDDASQGRAFSIIGPYGTGKSAFGVFLAHWVAANPDARDSLWKQHTLMEQRIVPFDSAQLLPIPLLVKATTLRQAIVATLHQHLSHIAPLHPLGGQLLLASENPDLPRRSGDLPRAVYRSRACQYAIPRGDADYRRAGATPGPHPSLGRFT